MSDLLMPIIVVLTALLASTLAAVAGFGGAVILLPVLVWAFGVRDAVPILTVIQVIGNLSRVYFNRQELVLPVAGWFVLGAAPASVFGAIVFATAPAPVLQRLLGLFLLAAVAYRHTQVGRRAKVGLRGFLAVGGVFGFLSALLGTVGPLAAPFFLSYGLVRGAYIGTEALTAVVMHAVKLLVYGRYELLNAPSVATGVAVGVVMIAGSYLGRRVVERLPERVFQWTIEAVVIASGLQFLLMS